MNKMKLIFDSCSTNESFARTSVAAFLTELNPTINELEDVKTAVSEAVTNAIIHGYENEKASVELTCILERENVTIMIEDFGKGIKDIEKAKEPFFTTKPELERSGMGFAFMEAFMDEVQIESEYGKGTRVILKKKIGKQEGWME